jgi:hypothetical protein
VWYKGERGGSDAVQPPATRRGIPRPLGGPPEYTASPPPVSTAPLRARGAVTPPPLALPSPLPPLVAGGTIGMKPNAEGSLEPCPGYLADRLVGMPEFSRAEMPAADLFEFSPLLDSSDMGPPDWAAIATLIETLYHTYDAFVVIMGTDTMAYAASALSFMVRRRPVRPPRSAARAGHPR